MGRQADGDSQRHLRTPPQHRLAAAPQHDPRNVPLQQIGPGGPRGGPADQSESIGAYLDRGQYSRRFREEYLVPMGAAIWSMPPQSLVDFPADSFIAFFDNHRLLHWNRPVWRTVSGGSRAYVAKLTASFADRIRTGVAVSNILRHDLGVTITDTTGHSERYDQVIIAAHSDQALAMLGDASS
jgi:uncharacterized protein